MRILVADNDVISRGIMESMLRRIGYDVEVAANGREALDKLLDRNGPRLALLDWMMPELDGPQVCRRIRASGERPYIYVALLTSKDSREDVVEGLDAGADDYLVKPCNAEELKARLRTGVRIVELEDSLVAAREEMRFKATHDALTSLWNRGKIIESLDFALRHVDTMAVLLCDIDHFKDINDMHGHLAGDAVLRELAHRLRSSVRANDLIGRYGGEEFLVVLDGCDSARLPERAERLRNVVSGGSFFTNGGAISFTVSIGAIAVERCASMPAETILQLADAALYQAKREGRNRVAIAGQLV